nr:ribonuclease H-like domain-containing protein [Tanacetum cinerariifolium]
MAISVSEAVRYAHITNCNPSRTPVDTDFKLGPEDIPYAVQQICLYMHDPREPHLAALKSILRYIRGTLDFRFHLYSSTTISLVGYTNADWAGYPSTRQSTSGYCVFLGDNLLSWSSKRQQTISHSSAESEYQGLANVVAETAWLRNLLRELHSPLSAATLVYYDNYADIFTKGLPSALFEDFRSSLSVCLSLARTARAEQDEEEEDEIFLNSFHQFMGFIMASLKVFAITMCLIRSLKKIGFPVSFYQFQDISLGVWLLFVRNMLSGEKFRPDILPPCLDGIVSKLGDEYNGGSRHELSGAAKHTCQRKQGTLKMLLIFLESESIVHILKLSY